MQEKIDRKNVMIFDGGIGTQLYERGFYINRPFEELNLSSPKDVIAVHESFINAGANFITTNTFGCTSYQLKRFDIEDRQEEIVQAALSNAGRAIENQKNKNTEETKVSFSIGPIGELIEPLGRISKGEAVREYERIAGFALGIETKPDFFFLETFTNLRELNCAIKGIQKALKGSGNQISVPIIASVSVKSSQESLLEAFIIEFGSREDLFAIGLNCSEGPYDLMKCLEQVAPYVNLPIVVRPNAGRPRQINGRYFYMSSPDYLAKFAKRYVEAGAFGVGGCCGTGPEHVVAIKNAVSMSIAQKKAEVQIKDNKLDQVQKDILDWRKRSKSKIGEFVNDKKKVCSIELNPPKGCDLEKFLNQIRKIKSAGVNFVNIPDGARASTRVSSLHMASFIAHQKQIDKSLDLTILPHFTCRDRNLIGLQSDLLGASINGVHDLLIVTGDPPKLGNNKEATAIYDVDSIGLTHLAECLNMGKSPNGELLGSQTQFGIGVASNPTAINLDLELERWGYKVDMGADFAVTQPIFEAEKLENWLNDLEKINKSKPHIIGIWPLISLRNAEFLANEVPGIYVPPKIISQFEKVKSKEDGIKLGLDISREVMNRLDKICAGYCISAPLGKVDVALELVK